MIFEEKVVLSAITLGILALSSSTWCTHIASRLEDYPVQSVEAEEILAAEVEFQSAEGDQASQIIAENVILREPDIQKAERMMHDDDYGPTRKHYRRSLEKEDVKHLIALRRNEPSPEVRKQLSKQIYRLRRQKIRIRRHLEVQHFWMSWAERNIQAPRNSFREAVLQQLGSDPSYAAAADDAQQTPTEQQASIDLYEAASTLHDEPELGAAPPWPLSGRAPDNRQAKMAAEVWQHMWIQQNLVSGGDAKAMPASPVFHRASLLQT